MWNAWISSYLPVVRRPELPVIYFTILGASPKRANTPHSSLLFFSLSLTPSKEEIKFLRFRHRRSFAARHGGGCEHFGSTGEKRSAQRRLIDSDAEHTRGTDVSDFQWWKQTVTSDTHDSADSDIYKRRL